MQFYRFVRGGIGLLKLAAAVALCATPLPVASAQTVYEGALSNQQAAEVVAWSTLYWQRVDQGGGSPGTGFVFTTAAMNSALFNPLRGTRATLEKVGSVSSAACDELGSTATPITTDQIALRGVFKKAMLEGKIETDAYTNSGGTITHANLILAAPASAGLTVYVDGAKLVSLDLPLERVNATAYQASLAMNLSAQSQGIIAALIASGAQWAADAGTVTESQKAITGQHSKADNFAQRIQWLLDAAGDVNYSSVEIFSAQFGVYGSLPVVTVQLGDALVLMDPLNGNISGPFTPDSKLDATGLLSVYSAYTAGSSVAYYSAGGCGATVAGTWRDWDPAWGTPPTKTPSTTTPRVPDGGGGIYTCGDQALGGCSCWRSVTVAPALPAPRLVRELCTYSGPGCGPSGGCTGTYNPSFPAGESPAAGQDCTKTCRLQYQ